MTVPLDLEPARDLPVLVPALGVAVLYLRGRARLPRAAVSPSGPFAVGLLAAVLALAGPVARASELLLTAHMVQHLLLVLVAAPLLAAARTGTALRAALPVAARRSAARASARLRRRLRRWGIPIVAAATLLHVVVLWLWHAPAVYDRAVRTDALHALEHATFLGAALWLWTAVFAAGRRSPRGEGVATLCLGAMIAQGGVLGALITFAGEPLYPSYGGAAGLTVLEDQQLGGALMWVVPGFVYAVPAVRAFARWLDRDEGAHPDPPSGRPSMVTRPSSRYPTR